MSETPRRFQGVGASPGVALGYVHLFDSRKMVVVRRSIGSNAVEEEIERFEGALAAVRDQFHQIRKKMAEEQGEDHVYLVEAQLLMLDDRTLSDSTRDLIREERINAEWALQRSLEHFKGMVDKIDDEYFRDRRSDIEYVEERLLRALMGRREQSYVSLQRKTILVAHDLSTTDLVRMNRENLAGFVTDVGGRTSHVVIVARSLGIPVVVGLSDISLMVENGERIALDGSDGTVVAHPTSETWREYEKKRDDFYAVRKELLKNRAFKAETKDQYEVHLYANVDLQEELPSAVENGAEGIGMLRTEHLFLSGQIPISVKEQCESYQRCLTGVHPREVLIRLLDVPGDNFFVATAFDRTKQNPALGLRGIRFLLKEEPILRDQLRAILRASAHGRVGVIYPMVSNVDEVRRANKILKEVEEELARENVKFDPDLRIGAMIETPSAALTADRIAQEVDFFSIGTNDLTQYTLAVDRSNELVADLFNPAHPAVLRLLKNIVDAGHKAGIEVGVCGEMAAEPSFAPLLVGLEVNFLSMNAGALPLVKQAIRDLTLTEAKEQLRRALRQ